MNQFRWLMAVGVGLELLLSTVVTCAKAPTSWTGLSADDAQVPEAVRDAYRDDAARLALRLMGGSAPDVVDLPPEPSRSLYQALIRVSNIPGLAARDSVVTLYQIHTFRMPDVRSLIVEVDSLAGWVSAWRQGEPLTGQPSIDHLMRQFELEVEHYQTYPAGWVHHWVRLKSRRPLNSAALAKQFLGIEGVLTASPAVPIGDGDDIAVSAQAGGWRLDYSVGYGDCPAGCIARHYWTFVVQPDGRVTYVGSRGDPTPPPDRRY